MLTRYSLRSSISNPISDYSVEFGRVLDNFVNALKVDRTSLLSDSLLVCDGSYLYSGRQNSMRGLMNVVQRFFR